ncbi:hypothetical protein ACET65_15135 [Aeromonas rivipollensis]
MTLNTTNPTLFCKSFIERELSDFKENKIWMTRWELMERMLSRAEEMSIVFQELVDAFGYSDTYEYRTPKGVYLWLTLEHIWMSGDFCKEEIVQARDYRKKLIAIQEKIIDHSAQLASLIREQDDIYHHSGFIRGQHQSALDMMVEAGSNNYLFTSYIADQLESLSGRYDLKYWPSRAELIDSLCIFERNQHDPEHIELPKKVLDGRASDIKDFVISFDNAFDDENDLPNNFRFSNNAMADIINVVLNLSPEYLITGDAIRIVRNRHC